MELRSRQQWRTWVTDRFRRTIRRPSPLRLAQRGSVGALVGLAVLALPDEPDGGIWAGITEAVETPWVLFPLAVAPLVVLLWTMRVAAFRRHIRVPGPIRLVSFEDATVPAPPSVVVTPGASVSDSGSGLGPSQPLNLVLGGLGGAAAPPDAPGAPIAQLAMHLRDRLSELRLPLPSAIPGAKGSSDFVELLGTTKVDVKQPFSSLGSLLRLVRPTHAYELRVKLLCRERRPTCGVAMELTMLPRAHAVFQTYWDRSWDDAIDRVASAVGAHIIPRSRHSESGPWFRWRRKALPVDLFHAYQRAERRWIERRYDDALTEFYAALRLDPANVHLRNELGKAQEARALYLDAMLTYHAGIQSLPVRSSKDLTDPAERAQRRLEILTRYRFTVLLGYGERLARQWLPPPSSARETRRSEELEQLRARLRPILRERYLDADGRLVAASDDLRLLGLDREDHAERLEGILSDAVRLPKPKRDEGPGKKEKVPTPTRDEIREAQRQRRQQRHRARAVRKAELRLVFQLFAEAEVRRMLDDFGDLEDEALAKLAAGLTVTSMQLAQPWARLRTEHARILLRGERGEDISESSWPPSPERIQALWRELVHRDANLERRLEMSNLFTDHYNAACTYAVGLAHEPTGVVSDDARRTLVRCSIAELRKALDVAPTSTIVARWEWITSKDPDLAGLRGEEEFRRFESERLPSSRPAPRRPADVEDFQASRDNKWLIRRYARTLERIWHGRAELTGPTDIHTAMRWWKDEAAAWSRARDLVVHHRHWQTRVATVRWLSNVAERNGVEPVRFVQPSYAVKPLSVDDSDVDREAAREINWTNLRLAALGRALDRRDPASDAQTRAGDSSQSLPGMAAWKWKFSALDDAGKNLDDDTRHRLAVQRARAWSAVYHFLDDEVEEADACCALDTAINGLAGAVEPPVPQPSDEPDVIEARWWRRFGDRAASPWNGHVRRRAPAPNGGPGRPPATE